MKHTIASALGLAILAGISLVTPAMAVISISWTSIGNAGNPADPATGYGSVDHTYNIGTYEVTNAQYVDFLNAKGSSNSAGIYNGTMGSYSNIIQSGSNGSYSYSVSSTYANMPVVAVTWFDAARFSNWLGNGQGSGSMETGAYTLNGSTSGFIAVNAAAGVYIPSENEWYKAAYYNKTSSTYSLYANGLNAITPGDANFAGSGALNVGYGKASSYGTFGQGGNAWEWNDSVNGSSRGLRGGAWDDASFSLTSSPHLNLDPSNEGHVIGFRVASSGLPVSNPIPEPTTAMLTILTASGLMIRRKR